MICFEIIIVKLKITFIVEVMFSNLCLTFIRRVDFWYNCNAIPVICQIQVLWKLKMNPCNIINPEVLHNVVINLPRLITKSNIHFVLELFNNAHSNIHHFISINIFVIFSTQLFCRLIIKKKAAVLWMLISVGIYQIYYVYSNRTVEWKLHWDPDVVSSP